jgi:hypothetical protein
VTFGPDKIRNAFFSLYYLRILYNHHERGPSFRHSGAPLAIWEPCVGCPLAGQLYQSTTAALGSAVSSYFYPREDAGDNDLILGMSGNNKRKSSDAASDPVGAAMGTPRAGGNAEATAQILKIAETKSPGTRAQYLALLEAINKPESDEENTDLDIDNRPRPPASLKTTGQTPPSSDDDEAQTTTNLTKDASEETGACELFYDAKEQSINYLFTMAIGVMDNGKAIFDVNEEPFASSNKKGQFKPTSATMKEEIARRTKLTGKEKAVKCKNYGRDKLREWLVANPITDPLDVKFLKKIVSAYSERLVKAKAEEATVLAGKEKEAQDDPRWTSSHEPYLRLYHCLCDDTVRQAFAVRDVPMNRQELDGRNSDEREPQQPATTT